MMKSKIIRELHALSGNFRTKTIKQLFVEDTNRSNSFCIKNEDLLYDYSKHLITEDVMKKLLELAETSEVNEKISDMRTGKKINLSEDNSVLHIALRGSHQTFPGSDDIEKRIDQLYHRMGVFSDSIRDGSFTGCTGKPINTIVNIGIGGSDLGVEMVYQALAFYASPDINVHFVSNVDPAQINQQLKNINPGSTLFIICSKSFLTIETLKNATAADKFMREYFGSNYDPSKHFCAITAKPELAVEFGIHADHVFPMWDWVGGRYSICATGLAVMIAVGTQHFRQFLAGFKQTDEHFFNAPFSENIPVIMALLGVWYNNILKYHSHAVIPYSSYLRRFSAYLQQADMESNGKSVDIHGSPVRCQTAPIIWGEPGTNAQHSFFQMIHQGTKVVPSDFIGFIQPLQDTDDMHDVLMSNFFAQQETLAFGKSAEEFAAENQNPSLIPFKVIRGNRPVSCLLFNTLTPHALGRLIALYEHKIFVQGIIWEINSFDQWGVELGKIKANKIMEEIKKGNVGALAHDSSTQQLIEHYLSVKNA